MTLIPLSELEKVRRGLESGKLKSMDKTQALALFAHLDKLSAIIARAKHHESCPRALSADYICDCPVGKLQKKMERMNGKV